MWAMGEIMFALFILRPLFRGSRCVPILPKIKDLDRRVNEVDQFYLTSSKKQSSASQKSSFVKDKEKVKHIPGFKKHQQDAARREVAAAKRIGSIMRQFGSIMRSERQEHEDCEDLKNNNGNNNLLETRDEHCWIKF